MQVICPQCRHSLDYTAERPRFCSFCGQSLSAASDVASDVDAPTLTAAPVADYSTVTKGDAGAPAGRFYQIDDVVGGYRLVRRIGAGAMGSVFEAEQGGSGQRVAIKLIAPDYAMSTAAVERFRLEGRLASTITHPSCVFVMAADEDEGQPFIVMELMPGTTLTTLVDEKGPLASLDAIRKILDVIDGLQEAHRLGVIHRDVKPSNCFVGADGRVKVGDFGLAKSVQEEGDLTRTGTFVGTVLFASPEQIKRQRLDVQSDVYSVCATLYFLLTGKPPFGGADALAAATRIVTEDPPTMRTLRPEISPALDRIVLKGLARDKGDRWHDLESLRQALERFLPGQMSFGGLGNRFVAHVIDMFVRGLVLLPTGLIWAERARSARATQSLDSLVALTGVDLLIAFALWCVYYGVMEGIWGFSLGKLAMGLRVCRADSVEPPGILRALLRTVVSYLLATAMGWMGFVVMAIATVFVDPAQPVTKVAIVMGVVLLAQVLGGLLGIALMCSTMRACNGYRGLHEIYSGTRVLEIARRKRRLRRFDGAVFSLQVFRPEGMPAKIGRFHVDGAVRWQADDRALVAHDPALHRAVWITMRTHRSTEAELARQQVTRPTRIRWVASGVEDGWTWDAYIAPGGMPLPVAIAREGRLRWGDAAPLIEQLTEELVSACEDGSMPELLSVHQVWIDQHGRVQVLGTPLTGDETRVTSPNVAREAAERPEARAMHLLRDVAARLLEGEAAGAELRGSLRAPVPRYVMACLNRLFPGPRCCGSLREFREELHGVMIQPAAVAPARRFAHICVLGLLMLASVGCLGMGGMFVPFFGELFRVSATERAVNDFETESQRDLAIASVQPDPGTRLAGLAQYADDQRRLGLARERLEEQREHLRARGEASPILRDQMQVFRGIETKGDPRAARRGLDKVLAEPPATNVGLSIAQWLYFLAGPLAWIGWAFVSRGGLSLRLLGIDLVRRDGRKAARWQCLVRALLFWAPPVALLGIAMLLDQHYWAGWYDPTFRATYAWMPVATWVAWLAGFGAFLVYFVRAVWRPEQSWHDRIAGTWLMPR